MYFSARTLSVWFVFLLIPRRKGAACSYAYSSSNCGKFVSATTPLQRTRSDGQAFKLAREAACAPQIDADV